MCYSINVHPDLKNKSLGLPRSELALEASVFLSGRAVSENSCIRGRCLFGGGFRELVQLVIRGECLTGDDSVAYHRSLA